jgi:hypothetical protein
MPRDSNKLLGRFLTLLYESFNSKGFRINKVVCQK